MVDRIFVSRLAVFGYHGVRDEEARLGQRFLVSLECVLDLSLAGRTDNHEHSLCYAELTEYTENFVRNKRFRTLEGLAEALCASLFVKFINLHFITARIEKPQAAIPHVFESIAIQIERMRPS
jgi:7,8-dihydroneopterin aldolase/epimerase/oxygenase